MRIALIALGSAGDVHPFLGIGRALAGRGHDVVVYTSEFFRDAVTRAGLEMGEGGMGRARFVELTEHPDLWHPRRAFPFVMREAVLHDLRRLTEELRREARAGDVVLVSSSLDLAGRLVHELHGVPHVTVHLAPSLFRTSHRLPVFPGVLPPWAPTWAKRALWRFADLLLDPGYVPALNAFRAELGLAPVTRPLDGWWNSPDLVLGLFPDWFGPVQPDWPPQLHLTGFPLFDDSATRPVDAAFDAWLDEGEPPIVFTLGSAMRRPGAFFREAAATATRLGRRAVLVGPDVPDLPRDLPPTVRRETFVPFSRLFPRAAALVSHGGIGTTAQALAAGIPHLAAPVAHDQFDNASRLVDLGVGGSLPHRRFTARRAATRLARLLDDPGVAARCAELRERVDGPAAIRATCNALEDAVALPSPRPFAR